MSSLLLPSSGQHPVLNRGHWQASGLSAWWPLGLCPEATDESLWSNDGTWDNGPEPSGAGGRRAMHFPGSARIDIDTVSLTGAKTVMFWVRFSSSPNTVLFGGTSRYYPYVDSSKFYLRDASVTSVSHGGLSADQWYHVAIAGDGTNVSVYLDGTSLGTGTDRAPDINTIGSYDNGSFSLTGFMADFRIYDRVHGADAIRCIYQQTLNGSCGDLCLPPAFRLWPVTTSAGTTISCTTGTAAASGLQAEVEQGTTVTCSLGTVTATGLQAEVEQGTTITCSTGTVTATGLAAQIGSGTTVQCSLGTVTATGLQAEVQHGTTINCSLASVAASGLQAEIEQGTTIACSTATVTAAGLKAHIGEGVTVSCSLGQVTATGLQAEVEQGTTIACSAGTVTVVANAVGIVVPIVCTTGVVTVSGLAVSVVTVTPNANNTWEPAGRGRTWHPDSVAQSTWHA